MLFRSGGHWVHNFFLRRGWLVRQRRLRRRRNDWHLPAAVAAEYLEDRTLLSTITVTSLSDNATADGQVTLREALQAANTDTSVDGSVAGQAGVQNIITFKPGLVGTISLNSSALGPLLISSSVKIAGLGSANTLIDAHQNSRVFNITNTAGVVTIDAVTLENGKTTGGGAFGKGGVALGGTGDGGAIRDLSTGQLTVSNSTISGSTTTGNSANGGAIYAAGPVALTNATISGNSVSGYFGSGAIFAKGAVTVTNATLSGNSTSGDLASGGAIFSDSSVTVSGSTLSGNSTLGFQSGGGAISAGGAVTVVNSTLSGNSTHGNFAGGGAIVAGTVTLTTTTLSGNYTSGSHSSGGALYSSGGSFYAPDVTITSSTFSSNTTLGSGSYGGAVYSISGNLLTVTGSLFSQNASSGNSGEGGAIFSKVPLFVSNSTLVGNSAKTSGGAIAASSTQSPVTVTNSTIVQNQSLTGAGGGIAAPTIVLHNAIVAQNTDNGTAPDLVLTGGGTLSVSHSLIGDNKGTPLVAAPVGSPDANGNLIGTDAATIDPKLGALADNGGLTKTMALLVGSPAINAGSNLLTILPGPDRVVGTSDDVQLTTDQRGAPYLRQAGTVDMGAYEFQIVVTSAGDQLDAVIDPAHLTLRDAVALANSTSGPDAITFSPTLNGTPINLTLGELLISDSVSITGDGSTKIVIDAGHNSRIFDVASSAGNVSISNLTLSDGTTTASGDSGGAISFHSAGTLTISNSLLTGNSTTGSNANGGAIYSSGTLSISNSTLTGNSTSGSSGSGGAISTQGALLVTNSTIVQNQATLGQGGGIAGSTTNAAMTLRNTILARNTDDGTALDLSPAVGASLTISHTLIGDNLGTGLTAAPLGAPDANGNLIGTHAAPIDPQLGPLANNGGATLTMAILAGSPALNSGRDALATDPGPDHIAGNADDLPLSTDQRGLGFYRLSGVAVDMGAFEVQNSSLFVTSANDQLDTTFDPAHLTLRDAVSIADNHAGADTIVFAASLNGTPIVLTLGDLVINDTVTITGNGSAATVIDAQHNSRIFEFTNRVANASFTGLTLKNGKTTANGARGPSNPSPGTGEGGAIRSISTGTLTFAGCVISGNSTTGYAAVGGAISTPGAVTLTGSTLTGNSTSGTYSSGGAVYAAGPVTVNGSTFSGNSTSGTFGNGSGSAGGAIAAGGALTITGSTFSHNSTVGDAGSGGAVACNGNVIVTQSTFAANSTAGQFAFGGAIAAAGGASVLNSTLSGNSVAGANSSGGAIFTNRGNVTLTNSTLSGNSATGAPGSGSNGGGGAVYASNGNVTVANSTIVHNQASLSHGGGLDVVSGALTLRNSIVALNTDSGSNPDLYVISSPLAAKHSLVGNNTGTSLAAAPVGTPDANGNLVGTGAAPIDPKLGPLASNGGPMQTMVLLAGSPAINAGDNTLAIDPVTTAALTSDERGVPFVRISGAAVDMGAFEVQGLVVPTVNARITNNNKPVLTGTFDQLNATVLQVTVAGTTFTLGTNAQLTSDGAGHWTLTPTSVIADGTYNVLVHTVDLSGNVANDATTNELTIDTVAPATPTVTPLLTNTHLPVISGTWGQGPTGGATVLQVTVNGTTYTLGDTHLTSDGAGHWTLHTNVSIADGTYSVAVHTADAAGNISDATATSALSIDTVPPATPTVNSLVTNNSKPTLTGTWDEQTASLLQVTINSVTYTRGDTHLTSNGSGLWTLHPSIVIPDGTFNVLVHTADAAGNIANDTTTNELTVDAHAPAAPTVNPLGTSNATPTLTGTWDHTSAGGATLLQVTVAGTTYTLGTNAQLTASGNNWTLNLTGTTPLASGTYDVVVHTADALGNVANDTTTNELVVDETAPTIGPVPPIFANPGEIATLTASINSDAPNGLTASINWGDGAITAATISSTGGLHLTGQHAYSTAGVFAIQVTVTNAVNLGQTVSTSAEVSQHGNLTLKAGSKALLTSTSATLTYDFTVQFVSGGIQLTGLHGTTFNGQATATISGAKSLSATLGNGHNQVRITGSGGAATLKLGSGHNDLTIQNFTGGAVSATATGGLTTNAINSTLASLKLTAGAVAGNAFQAQGLTVTGSTAVTLGAGANDSVVINDSHLGALLLKMAGPGALVQIEAGPANGVGTQIAGKVAMTFGGSAHIFISPSAGSDQSNFKGTVTIKAAQPNAQLTRQNVIFVKPPKVTNVTIV